MTSILDQLRTMTTVVADTGELAAVRTYAPVDCTTNPSLVLAALRDGASEDLIVRELGRRLSLRRSHIPWRRRRRCAQGGKRERTMGTMLS